MTDNQDPSNTTSVDDGDACLALSRGRRERKGKQNKFAALAKLKEAKAGGRKNKWADDDDYDNIYEEVDEVEYSKIVRERQEDDWIVDDDGSGYVEDGREIFDEEFDGGDKGEGESSNAAAKKRKQNPNIRAPNSKPKSIKSMFAAQAGRSKPKIERDINLNDDDLLGDIMSELQQKPATNLLPPAVKLKKKILTPKAPVNPFSSKTQAKKPNPVKTMAPPVEKAVNQEPEVATHEDEEMEITEVPSQPVKKVNKMKTALDQLQFEEDMDSPTITGYDSQHSQKSSSGVSSQGPSQEANIDVSGIDFDDEMDEEKSQKTRGRNFVTASNNKENQQPNNRGVSSQWQGKDMTDAADIPIDVVVDSSKLPVTEVDGEQVLRMFWLDAYEDQYKQPGTVYLFGKVWIESAKTHVSCCVAVKNIERSVYILPRSTRVNPKTNYDTGEPVTILNVYDEFSTKVCEKYKINKYKSKKTVKQYAFEKVDVPVEAEYLEIRYSAEYPALPQDLSGETFSHVFGVNTPSLEIFLIERKIKGPCWVDIKLPQIPNPNVSWAKVEAFVTRPENISVVSSQPPPPPVIVMTLNLRTVPNPKTHQNEVVAAAGLIHHQVYMDRPAPNPQFQQHFAVLTKPSDCVFPYDFKEQLNKNNQSMKVEVLGYERGLLGYLLAKIHKLDPDIIVGHDIYGFHLDVLLHRIAHNKVPHWSKLGRLKRATMPKLAGVGGAKSSAAASATSGRLVCDVQISARELMRCKSYDLTELTSQILKDRRRVIDVEDIPGRYNNSKLLLEMLDWTLHDSNYILRLMYELNVVPLALQITNICGNVMSRTLMGGRSERNEYLLLHAFTEKNFIVPDKYQNRKLVQVTQEAHGDEDDDGHATTSGKKASGRRKPAYAGGLVLEPKKGFYDKYILLLDFNSLYPSIIQEYNICFTTINRNSHVTQQEGEEEMNIELPDESLDPGILPTEIRKLVQSRKQVKQLMKNPDLAQELHMQYDIRQKALKLTANSMYGCLGFTFSRFFAKPLAALVTGKGREILLKTKDLVQSMNLDVIYGDTDSIMINTNCTDMDTVFKLGNKVKTEVNKLYKLLEIDIDGVFKSMLLLKKKKYAALNITKVGDKYVESQELKGLDIVRRDWCELAKTTGNFVVSKILSGATRETIVEDIHSELIRVATEVNEAKVPLEMFYITKQLTKNPEDYPDKKSLSHVQVALRLNSKGGRKMRAGDTVYYVICEDGSSQAPTQRAYHPDEVLKNENLKVDTKYYLSNQVHPVVSRLCDPIDGTDAAHLAECLGLDPSGYRHAMRMAENEEEEAMLGGAAISEQEKYKDCERLKFSCPECDKEVILDAPYTGAGEYIELSLEKCPGCKKGLTEHKPIIMNRLTMLIRTHINKYYQGWLCCEDTTCNARVRRVGLLLKRGQPICHVCQRGFLHPEYKDCDLYNQLCFYQYLFDIEKAQKHMTDARERDMAKKRSLDFREDYLKLKLHVEQRIKQSAYGEVNLSRLFQGLFGFK